MYAHLIQWKRGRVLRGERTQTETLARPISLPLQGRQFPDANLPGVPPDQTKAIFEAAIRTLVQLHSVDTDKLDLDGIGDKENFFHQKVRIQQTNQSHNSKYPPVHHVIRIASCGYNHIMNAVVTFREQTKLFDVQKGLSISFLSFSWICCTKGTKERK